MKTRNKVLMALGTLGIAGASFMGSAHADTIKTFNKSSIAPFHQERQAIETAIANNDYTAFKSAIANKQKPSSAPEVTEAMFAKLVEAHKLRQNGDISGAQKIMTELGFAKPSRLGKYGGDMKRQHNMMLSRFTAAQKQAWIKMHQQDLNQ